MHGGDDSDEAGDRQGAQQDHEHVAATFAGSGDGSRRQGDADALRPMA